MSDKRFITSAPMLTTRDDASVPFARTLFGSTAADSSIRVGESRHLTLTPSRQTGVLTKILLRVVPSGFGPSFA